MSNVNNGKLQKLDDAALGQVSGGKILFKDMLLDSREDDLNDKLNAQQKEPAKNTNRPPIVQA